MAPPAPTPQLGSVAQWSYWSDVRRVHDFQHVTDRTLSARRADVHILLSRLRSHSGAYRQLGCLYPIAAAVQRDQLVPVRLLPAQVTRAMLNRFSRLSHHVPRWFVSSPPNAWLCGENQRALASSHSKHGPLSSPLCLATQILTSSPTWSWLA
jgi:hypothetical protein